MRPGITLLTRPPSWLGGGAHVQQLVETVRASEHADDRVVRVGSLRGGPADLRLPSGLLNRIGPRPSRALGGLLWRGRCVHRVSIDLPPARNELISILDLAPLHFADEGALPTDLRDQVRRARGVVVSTQVIAEEVLARFGAARTWLIPPAVGHRFFAVPPAPLSPNRGPTVAPYVLHMGGATERKGLARLADAWPQIKSQVPELELVMVGPEHANGRAALLPQPGIRWSGLATDDSLVDLMRGARAVVVPSTYEGFGMPVAEAMALGVPVVVLGGTAPAEVGGDVAFIADPDGGAEALAQTVVAAVQTSDDARVVRGRERAGRWSIEEVRRLQLLAYDEAFT